MQESLYDALMQSMLFIDISREEMKTMLKCLNPKVETYKKGEFVARWGEPMEGLGILLEGSLSVLKENLDGSRIIMHMLEIGELFGEMAVFAVKRRWPATILSQEDSTVLFITPDKIIGRCANVCEFHRQLILNMLKIVSDKAQKLNKKVEYLSIKGMREKICTYLWEEYKRNGKLIFLLPMKRNELADFLNVSRPSMSREMCRMRDEGLIDFHLSTIRILNPERVAAYVQ